MKSYVAGHTGMVGSALCRLLGDAAVFPSIRHDLRVPDASDDALYDTDPQCVYLAAAKVGGIGANAADPISFLTDNLQIGLNVIRNTFIYPIRNLLNFGSSCIYPRDAPQPLREEYLLTGPLEPTNEAYALAKIAVLKLTDFYRREHSLRYYSLMPTNLYGPGDRYDGFGSHVIPAMILKFEAARRKGEGSVKLWGSGKPLREFLFVDDLAKAAVMMMKDYNGSEGWLNIGSGEEISIGDLSLLIAKIVGYEGKIVWNREMPDGTPRKLLDSTKIRDFGWKPKVFLEEGLEIAVEDYRKNYDRLGPIPF